MEAVATIPPVADVPVEDRPSVDFVRAVARLLETDAEDLLIELGYVYSEAIVVQREPAQA